MVVRDLSLAEACNFEEMKRDQEYHSYTWFRFRGIVFDGFYLLYGMELTSRTETMLSTEDIAARLGDGELMFLVRDLSMWLGYLTDDLTTAHQIEY